MYWHFKLVYKFSFVRDNLYSISSFVYEYTSFDNIEGIISITTKSLLKQMLLLVIKDDKLVYYLHVLGIDNYS